MHTAVVIVLDTGLSWATACLEHIAALPDGDAVDVVVVDNGSADLHPLLDALQGDVTVVRVERTRRAAALNAGLEHVRAPAVAVLPASGCVHEGWLRELLAALEQPGVAAAGSVTQNAAFTHPVEAPAVAWRTADLPRVPDVPDHLVCAAVCAELARLGRVVHTPGSCVAVRQPRHTSARTHGGFGGTPELSVVIPTLDALSDRVRTCVAALQAHTEVTHEIIIVDNGAPPQGFTAPVNAGIRAARGRYVAVCNDDVQVLPGWWAPLQRAMDAGSPVVFPITLGERTRADFSAWCFAMTRETVRLHAVHANEFFDPELVVWFQDTDLLGRLHAAGTPPLMVPTSHVRHGLSVTVASEDPALLSWVRRQTEEDQRRYEAKHIILQDNPPQSA